MYQVGEPQYFGPGTALVERWPDGFGDYVQTQNFMMTPAGQMGILGLGCACNGACETCNKGVGAFMDGTGLLGTGLFTSSTPADWGAGEWTAIGIGAYVFLSVFDTSRRVGRSARAAGRAASQEYGLRRSSGKPASRKRK